MTCKNCDKPVIGNFCATCGQKGDVHQITLKHVVHEFLHAFTHADKGFLLLIKRLILKPGIVAKEYIEGKRKRYFNPLSFLVITSAVQAYITHKVGYFEAMSAGRGGPMQDSTGSTKGDLMRAEVFKFSADNEKVLTLFLIVPLLTLFCRAFFWRPKHNLAEHFVIQSFIVGQANVIRVLIFVPLFLLSPSTIHYQGMVYQLLLAIYMTVAYRQFFHKNIIITFLKAILMMVLFILCYWIFIAGYVFLKHLFF
ncbi:MAG: DUF3667 domain-containing protein [Bacteroidota bacterium]